MTLLAKQNAHELDQYIKFFPVEHKYTFRDQNINRSVTELVHQQFPRFNADTVAEQMSRKHYNNKKNQYYQKTKEDILQLWEDNKNDACSKGTDLHQCIEYVYNGITVENDTKEFSFFKNFQRDYSHLVPYRTEWEVCYEEKSLAGSIDMIFKNPDGTFSIYDWKRCKRLEKSNNFEFGFDELDHLPNCNFWHYTLQLNIYKYILEYKYNFTIKSLHLVVMHPNNSNYQIYECPNLQAEVKSIMDKLHEVS